jgi:hypothetical protein
MYLSSWNNSGAMRTNILWPFFFPFGKVYEYRRMKRKTATSPTTNISQLHHQGTPIVLPSFPVKDNLFMKGSMAFIIPNQTGVITKKPQGKQRNLYRLKCNFFSSLIRIAHS